MSELPVYQSSLKHTIFSFLLKIVYISDGDIALFLSQIALNVNML